VDRFTIPKLEERAAEIGRLVYKERLAVQPVRWLEGWPEGAENGSYDDSGWQAAETPQTWGGRDVKAYFRCRFAVPTAWRGEKVALRVALAEGLDVSGPDATVYLDGRSLQGADIYHGEVLLPDEAKRGEHVLALEA
jgi:hypothetical protein